MNYTRTVQSCYLSYVSHAVINGLPALLFTVLAGRYGLGYERLGRLVLINFVTHLAVDALAVRLADRVGYRRCLVTAHAMAALGLALFGLLPGWLPSGYTYAGLCFAVAVCSVGGGLIQCLVSPGVSQISVSAGAMTLLHSFYPVGSVMTVLVSTVALRVLPEWLWYALPLAWTVVPLLTMAGFMTSPMAEPRMNETPSQPLRELARGRGFWLFVGMMSFAGATEASMGQWSSLFAEQGIGVSKLAGDLLGPCVSAAVMAAIRMTCGRWERFVPLEKFLAFACAGSAGCFALAALSKNPAFALAALTLSGVAIAMLWPGTVHRGARGFPRGGTALFGMLAAGGDFGCSLGPWLLGAVGDKAGLRYGMLAGAAFPLGFLALLMTERRGRDSHA
ncbi:MAG: MFS transporter [Oscillospiraceae bacterium]|jgi:fucose permease|nr:MFS transporter [Oscillospiraceae bacterium]